MRPRTIAVDFDGTISLGEWPGLGEPNLPLVEWLKASQKAGCKVILWTCRTGDLLESAVGYCERFGLLFDAVNENLPETIALYGGDSRKVTADLYIDDKALVPARQRVLRAAS